MVTALLVRNYQIKLLKKYLVYSPGFVYLISLIFHST